MLFWYVPAWPVPKSPAMPVIRGNDGFASCETKLGEKPSCVGSKPAPCVVLRLSVAVDGEAQVQDLGWAHGPHVIDAQRSRECAPCWLPVAMLLKKLSRDSCRWSQRNDDEAALRVAPVLISADGEYGKYVLCAWPTKQSCCTALPVLIAGRVRAAGRISRIFSAMGLSWVAGIMSPGKSVRLPVFVSTRGADRRPGSGSGLTVPFITWVVKDWLKSPCALECGRHAIACCRAADRCYACRHRRRRRRSSLCRCRASESRPGRRKCPRIR